QCLTMDYDPFSLQKKLRGQGFTNDDIADFSAILPPPSTRLFHSLVLLSYLTSLNSSLILSRDFVKAR
ncbi:hypothetical protein ACFLVN_02790, partial [Chloroflexota bacterium]